MRSGSQPSQIQMEAVRSKKREDILAELIELDGNGANNQTLSPLEKQKTHLIKMILQSSYLPKLYGKGKEYTQRGHELEKRYAKALMEDSKNQAPGCPVLTTIFENGMIANKGSLYTKDSNDFIAVEQREDNRQSNIVEPSISRFALPLGMKARLSPATAQKERELLANANSVLEKTQASTSLSTGTTKTFQSMYLVGMKPFKFFTMHTAGNQIEQC